MDTLGRVIKRVASGSVSTSNRFAQLEALDALSGQVWLTSDLNHLAEEAVYRPLAAHAGFIDLQCGSLAAPTVPVIAMVLFGGEPDGATPSPAPQGLLL